MPVITYRDALGAAIREEMQRDDRVFLMGEEVAVYQGAYKVSKGFLQEFARLGGCVALLLPMNVQFGLIDPSVAYWDGIVVANRICRLRGIAVAHDYAAAAPYRSLALSSIHFIRKLCFKCEVKFLPVS